MRTKVLLSLAAFAVSAFAAYAQSNVYSVNVVGYVNKTYPANTLIATANPLDSGSNTLNGTCAVFANKSIASFWNSGSGTFSSVTKAGGSWPGDPATPVGEGFFIRSAGTITNTFVGEVVVGPGESTTNNLPANILSMVGSAIPYGGDYNDANLNLALPNKSILSKWVPTSSAYSNLTRAGGVWPANPGLEVGEGFFLRSATAYPWVQSLPAN